MATTYTYGTIKDTGTAGQVLKSNGPGVAPSFQTANAGTVTSVAVSGDGTVIASSLSGSPITSSGTITLALVSASGNTILASPVGGGSGAPTYRTLALADMASLTTGSSSGQVLTSNGSGSAPSWQAAGSGSSGFPAVATVVNQTTSATYTTADRGKLWHNTGASSTTTYTLPASASIGDTYWAISQNQTNFVKIQQNNASDIIKLPYTTTSAGNTHGIQYNTGGRSGPGVIALTYVATKTWVWTGGYPFDWAIF